MSDVWDVQAELGARLRGWARGSLALGGLVAARGLRRGDRELRSMGLQTAAWGAVDEGIARFGDRRRAARLRDLPDPQQPDVLAREARSLQRLLLVNAGLDVGYVAAGHLWGRRARPGALGNGTAVVVQGLFLLGLDLWYARRARQLRGAAAPALSPPGAPPTPAAPAATTRRRGTRHGR